MDPKPPNSREIAGSYAGNPSYFGKPHYLRRLRGWCFVIAVLGSIAAAVTYGRWGNASAFSKGPVSERHARFANDCRACHADAQTDLLKAVTGENPGRRPLDKVVAAAFMQQRAGHGTAAAMDQACLKCHPAAGLHLPQPADLAVRAVSSELPVVHAENCFTCHREHAGSGRMALPSRQSCVSCHGDAAALANARKSAPQKGAPVATAGENRDLGDGVIRFLAPANASAAPKAFADYAHGHPPFTYEHPGVRDPAELKFNHARHERADVQAMGRGKKLGCTDCHTPGAGGVLYQPVSYERHCAECHSLQILPSFPKLRIPHGDADKVRYFLAGLAVSVGGAIRAEGVSDPAQLAKRVDDEMQSLRVRGLDTPEKFERRVFFEGEPRDDPNDRRMRSGSRKFLTECAKCHTVTPTGINGAPQVRPPTMAERWVQHGPFTHLPHRHVDCAGCHGAAATSKETTDILLPPQKLCAECHRPPAAEGRAASLAAAKSAPSPENGGREIAAAQRREGGIKWDCQSCHRFHTSPDAGPSLPAPLLKAAK